MDGIGWALQISHAKGILRAALRSSNAGPVIKPSLVASNDVSDLTSRMGGKKACCFESAQRGKVSRPYTAVSLSSVR